MYHVTGVRPNGRRFKRIATPNLWHALGINLWRGSVWAVRNGRRQLVRRVWN